MKHHITILTTVGLLVIIFGTIYAVVQQSERSAANYPQIQMAEDTAVQINNYKDPYVASKQSPVNIGSSLAPFTIIYDQKGRVVSGYGYLNGKVPTMSLSTLESSKGKTYSAVTWQPQKGVRIAAVTVAAKNYYVMSGRSLTEVEKNETHTFQISLAGGILSLLLVGAGVAARIVTDKMVVAGH